MTDLLEALRISFYVVVYAILGCGGGDLFASPAEYETSETLLSVDKVYIPVEAYEVISLEHPPSGDLYPDSGDIPQEYIHCAPARHLAICGDRGTVTIIKFNMCGEFDIRVMPENERHPIACD